MSNGRLPPLQSTSLDDNGDILESPTASSENAVRTRRKKKTVDNNDEIYHDSETADSRPRRRQRASRVRSPDNPVTDESGTEGASPRVKPVRKTRKPPVIGSNEQLVSDVTEPNTNINNAPAKKKRKTKSRQTNVTSNGERGLVSELTDLGDDIVDTTTEITTVDETAASPVVMKSEPTQKVYLEKSNGFKATDRNRLTQKRALAADAVAKTTDDVIPVNTVQFALSTHRVFKTLALFLQGTFAGIALWQIVTTSLMITNGSTAFSQYYMQLSIPIQCLYFFLFAVASVEVLDRYDLANTTRRLLIKSVSFQAGTICVLMYFCGLILSLATAPLDEGIGLNQTALMANQTASSSCQWLCEWQILNITRGVLAILGWFVVSLRPGTDRLTKSLLQANDEILQPNSNANNSATNAKTADSNLWNTQTNA